MPVFELYSRRKKRAGQVEPDVYQYDSVPQPLRIQIAMILSAAIGPWSADTYHANSNDCWEFICNNLRKEKGLARLISASNPREEVLTFLQSSPAVDDCLDVVEFSFRIIHTFIRDMEDYDRAKRRGITQEPEDAIVELNFRMREAAVGYQFENGQIVRVDSQFVHSEVVQPALQLLSDPRFKGAQEEFLAAHAHYRAGEYKDAAADALNAFESALKTICDLKKWRYPKGARATDLLKIVRNDGLLPDYLDNSFDQLVATLSSGLPKVRNEEGGHGQGATPKETPSYVAAYALHLAAAKVVLLVEAFNASGKKKAK